MQFHDQGEVKNSRERGGKGNNQDKVWLKLEQLIVEENTSPLSRAAKERSLT